MGDTAMRRKGLYRSVAFLAIAGLIAGACGDDDSAPADTPEETSEEAESPAEEPAEEPAVEAGDEAEGDVDTAIEEEESAVAYGGSISVGVEAEATGLRPWEDTCSSPCYNMMIAVFDKLVEMDVNATTCLTSQRADIKRGFHRLDNDSPQRRDIP